MSSHFETLAKSLATPAFVEHFGERDGSGELAEVISIEPDRTNVSLRGVIIHSLRITDEIEDEHSTHVLDQVEDVVELHIPITQGDGEYLPRTEVRYEIPELPGGVFTVHDVLSISEGLAHVRCGRRHVTRIQQRTSERKI